MEGRFTGRQSFRVGIMESIAIPMLCLPFFLVHFCGKWHFIGMIVGIIGVVIYSYVMYIYSQSVDMFSKSSRLIRLIYVARYVLRAGIILSFFSYVVSIYFGVREIFGVIIFAVLCGYGTGNNISKRGRIVEFLYGFTIFPLIAVGALLVSDVRWKEVVSVSGEFFYGGRDKGMLSILLGAYLVVMFLSNIEFMQFNFSLKRIDKEYTFYNFFKVIIWVIIAVVLGYLFVIGSVGVEFLEKNPDSNWKVFGIWEFPGSFLLRLDYVLLLILMIAIFGTISGCIFYSWLFVGTINEKMAARGRFIITACIALLGLAMSLNGLSNVIFRFGIRYMIYFDLALSILLPLLELCRKSGKKEGVELE